MQLYKEQLLVRETRRGYEKAVERDRLARLARAGARRSLRQRTRKLLQIIGLFFAL